MKKIYTLFFILSVAVTLASAQHITGKPRFDASGRVVRDASGKRITYADTTVRLTVPARNTGKKLKQAPVTTVPLCSPSWFQGTMGTCIGLNSTITQDIDHDGKTEVICGAGSGFGSGIFWYVLRYDAMTQEYHQTWMSPPLDFNAWDELFSVIRAYDTDNDNIAEIFVGYENGKVEIYKGSDMSMIRSFSTGTTAVNDIVYADADNDGQKEIVFCSDDHTYLYNSSNFTLKQTLPYGSYRFAVGNVDSDPRNEIVYSNGTVLDLNGTSATVEWNIYTPSLDYALVGLTDTDGDGMDEIIIAKPWNAIEVYDADLKALKGTITTDIDIDALLLSDVNGDGKKEILYGDGQWGSIHCINPVTLTESWAIPNPEHGVTQVAVADGDNDGQPEIFWGAGCTSTGEDHLYVSDIATQASEFISKDIDGPFYALETGDVDGDGNDEIVTLSYTSNSGYDSGILSIFNGTTGSLKWQSDGSFIPDTWEGIYTMKLADVTGDATKEIIVGTGNFYDGAVYIINGSTHQVISSKIFSSEGMEVIYALAVSDVDNDGKPELVMADYSYLYVVDPVSLTIKWTSPVVPGSGVKTVKVGNLDSDPNQEIVVSKGYVTVYDGVTHGQWTSAESNITNIDLYDWDNDGVEEIIAATDDGKILMMDRQTGLTTLLVQTSLQQIDGIRVVNLDGTGLPEFVLTSGGKIWFANAAGDLLSTTAFGPYAGSYDAIKISDVNKDGIREIFAGTEYQVVEITESCSQCLGFKGIATSTKASCEPGHDGTATVTLTAGTSPFSFQWSNGSTSQSISGLAPGQYSVVVTDSKGCPTQDTVTITQAYINASISGKDVGCKGIQDGSASVSIISGTTPYQYIWSNGGTQQAISGLSPGNYSCIVKDNKNCTVTKEITIRKDSVMINLTTYNPQCFGNSGAAMIQVYRGTPPFAYLWNGVPGNSLNNNIQPGSYTLTVRDTLNCSFSNIFKITSPPPIVLNTSFIPDNPSTPEPDGQATVTVSGGIPPYYYSWDDPYNQHNATATNLSKGHYDVTVMDQNDCNKTIGVDLYGVSVEEAGKDAFNLKVFPNPASSIINVTAMFDQPCSGTVQLADITGKVIDSRQFSNQKTPAVSFDLKGYPASLYVVLVQCEGTTLIRRIIVKD